MLPYLKPKMQPSLIVETRKADNTKETKPEDDDSGIVSCAEDLIRAVHAKDAKSVAAALRAAFDVLDSAEPEADDESFDAQNAKAASFEAGE